MPFLLTPLFVPETLIDESRLPDNRLPDTGVGLDKEQLLSPMFITSKSFQYLSAISIIPKLICGLLLTFNFC